MLSTPAAAVMAVGCLLLLLRTFLSLPSLLHLLVLLWRRADDLTHSHQTFRIPRRNDDYLEEINPLFRKAIAYLSSLHAAEDSDNASLFSSPLRANDFSLQLSPGQTVRDSFHGARLSWTLLPHSSGDALLLCLRRHDRHRVLRPYLQHVEAVADDMELRRKETKLYTNAGGLRWRSMAMTHPANFDKVVMDTELMGRVRSDLEQFLKGRAYYARLGRLWKRSYLLYGPPGTGKSTFVAAMARFLCYDIYDLDLSRVSNTADLRSLLQDTTPRSIILVEHIDRYLAAGGDITGLLCFMDGVLSCCGEGG
ncbi:hypothetical protein HPP92_020647 [Vanilla planifolia]|uniref:Uncharacterized protein n=1 Tax=Vanilla planifolia TaxID=51239 RepID=A0A835PX99_VANPL|nr:hypothetical protein HPP92_020647 [Vanilla planifolia]